MIDKKQRPASPKPVPTCEHRDWLDDDEALPTGTVCGKPAAWLSCSPLRDSPSCDAHRCRCKKPIPRTDSERSDGQ